MISYVKLYGPPIYDAIKELEKIAVGMPEVCIMSTTYVASMVPNVADPETAYHYFMDTGISEITKKRCNTIISKSSERLGEYDFFFEWFKKPTMVELNDLIKRIDNALKPVGTRYSITTK
jgi:hypothetical protein